MTTFKQSFNQMFKVKWKWIKILWLVQILILIFGTAVLIIQHPHGVSVDASSFSSLFFDFDNNLYAVPVNLSSFLIIWCDIVFLGILIWQSYKINLSQTWRLLAQSDSKLWQSNLLSSFLSCCTVFIPQVIAYLILLVIENTFSKTHPINNLFNADFQNHLLQNLLNFTSFFLILIAFVLLILTFADFTIFSSRAVVDFLPFKNEKVIRATLIIVLIMIGVYFGSTIINETIAITGKFTDKMILANSGYNKIMATNNPIYNFYYNLSSLVMILEFAIAALIFGFLDSWLIKDFVEAKIKTV